MKEHESMKSYQINFVWEETVFETVSDAKRAIPLLHHEELKGKIPTKDING